MQRKLQVFVSSTYVDMREERQVAVSLLKAFQATVTSKICRFFGDVNELKLIVLQSVARFALDQDLSGWVRRSDVVDPKATLEEMERLRGENTELRRQLAEWEASKLASVSPDSPAEVASQLNEDAKVLLVDAKDGDGQILYARHSGGASLGTGTKNFLEPYSDREDARWRSALFELRDHRLADDTSSNGTIFRLTRLGYQVADLIDDSSTPSATSSA